MKIMKTLLAGLSAAALLFAASCTGQVDYLNANTNRSAVKIAGFKVTGLDASQNGATAKLMIVEGESEGALGSAIVADSYLAADGETTIGYAAGTAYTKFAKEELVDTDVTKSSKIVVYLQVGNKKYKVAKADGTGVENASLSIPTSNPGTADADLPVKYIDVTVNGDVAAFAWADKIDEPVNVTLYQVKLDVLDATADTLPTGVTVKTTAKTGTNQKFTLTLSGLEENAGTEVVLGGADINTADEGLAGNWYDDSKFKQKIGSDGKVTWTFYGSAVNGGNIAGWGRTYDKSVAGPEIIINMADPEKKENGVRLLDSGVTRNGNAGDSENFMFPGYTIGNYDVEMEIDVSKLEESKKTKADPVSPVMSFNIDGIKIIGAPTPKDGEDEEGNPVSEKAYILNADDDDERIMWVPEAENWNNTAHSYKKSEINSNGNYAWRFDAPVTITPNAETFKIGARVLTPEVGGGFWANQSGQFYSPHYNTAEMKNGSYTLIIDLKSNKEYLVPTAGVDYEFEYKFTKVVAKTTFTEEVELVGVFNGWAGAAGYTEVVGVTVGETTEFDVSGVTLVNGFKIRTHGTWEGAVNCGSKTGANGNMDLPVITGNGNYVLVFEDLDDPKGAFSKIYVESAD